ncbi:azurin [Robertkochia sediminum]|uniref:azurin n=1 Tax=Robertkochia sediminum TaxID=2785326 RepID=UPI00193380C1|nr:azurin [Robertkochia sediminum]MBL7471908.1 azurin [Robertkochia sediminum]
MRTILSTMLSLSLLLFMSCGQGQKEEKKDGFQYEQAPEKEAPASDKAEDGIVITGNDMMQYNTKEIRVKAGTTVTLTLKHIGKLDKQVMGHNWVLLKQGADLIGFASQASSAQESDYIPEGTEDVIAHTKMLGGGQTDTITFEAPAPGTYQFLCSFPGHFAQMQGTFIVEE